MHHFSFYLFLHNKSFCIIFVENSMSCHSSALIHYHKLIHLSVTDSGAFAPVFLLHPACHLMIGNKPHHMLIYQ